MATSPAQMAATWRERYSEIVAGVYHRYSDLVVESARGAHLYTVDDRDVLDFGSGIAVNNLGHCHPAVDAAVRAQLDKVWHTSVTAIHPRIIEAAERLVDICPEGLNQAFFCNSGAEAIEGAIKLARRATGRSDVISFFGSFHGRTYGALSLTSSNANYHHKMGPFLPGIHHVAYPYCLHTCTHAPGERCPIAEGEEIEQLFKTMVAPDEVAAIVVEPILGEGGYVVPPPRFLPRLREICDQHGIMLVVDEVQSGMARTGKMFACDYTGTVPDIMTVAKALGNGLPIAAIVAKHGVMRAWNEGEHGTTFGGNPVACAAAIAVVDTIVKEDMCARAVASGARVMKRVKSWQELYPEIVDVRGLGLMIGIEFARKGQPARSLVDSIQRRAAEIGLLVLTAAPDQNVIRICPPIVTPDSELDQGLDLLETAIKESRS